MASIFDKILEERPEGSQTPFEWFQERIKNLTTSANVVLSQGRRTATLNLYRFNMFFYDPITKDKLEYFDMFPLVFPLRRVSGGFLGLNAHYLPMDLREDFYTIFQNYRTSDDIDENTLYRTTWARVKRFKLIRPLIKKYLFSQVKSQFLKINADEVPVALLLPIERFKKTGKDFSRTARRQRQIVREVHINTRKKIRQGKS
jgi:hypothetical protein|tara:strand:- start:1229 stop:1834 length:606 start_codon:yes stop_codon:yes gene_type:complete